MTQRTFSKTGVFLIIAGFICLFIFVALNQITGEENILHNPTFAAYAGWLLISCGMLILTCVGVMIAVKAIYKKLKP